MKRTLLAASLVALTFAAFAEVPISALPAGATLTGAEEVPAVQSAVTVKTTTADISAYSALQLQQSALFDPSGAWTFTHASTAGFPSLSVASNSPQFELQYVPGGADAKRWQWGAISNGLEMATCNDSGSSCSPYMSVSRSGGVATDIRVSFPLKLNWTSATNISPGLTLASSAPVIELSNTNNSANNRRSIEWIEATNGTHHHSVCQDNTTCNDYLRIARSGSSVTNFAILTNNGSSRLAIDTAGVWNVEGAPGTNGQVLTSTGNATPPAWTTPSTGSPGGATTNIQYNDAGAFGGEGDFTWNSSTNVMGLGSAATPPFINAPTNAGAGINLTVRGGAASGAGNAAGDVLIRGGVPADGAGGDVSVTAESGVGTNRGGGSITLSAGANTGNATSGNVSIFSGAGGATSGPAGSISLVAANGGAPNGNGGNLILQAGNPSGSGTQGALQLINMTATGAQSATFSATNKPGVGAGGPTLWLRVVVSGTTYWVPLFAN